MNEFLDEYLRCRPKKALLELTYNCNQACPFCYCVWLARPELYHEELSIDDWKRVVALIVEHGTRQITFSGGEPLLKRGGEEVVASARSLSSELKLTLFTNGTLVDERTFDVLLRCDCEFATTFPGVRRLDRLTGRDARYSNAAAVIKAASERGLRVGASVPVSTLNLRDLRTTLSAACLAGANAITVGPVLPEGRATFNPEFALNDKQFESAKKKAEQVDALFGNCSINFVTERACSCSVKENNYRFVRTGTCPAGRTFFAVSPGGYFRQCLHSKVDEFFWKDLESADSTPR